MSRYSVYHETTNGKDGDAPFENIKDAWDAYHAARSNPRNVRVELVDNATPAEPVSIAYYDAETEVDP